MCVASLEVVAVSTRTVLYCWNSVIRFGDGSRDETECQALQVSADTGRSLQRRWARCVSDSAGRREHDQWDALGLVCADAARVAGHRGEMDVREVHRVRYGGGGN